MSSADLFFFVALFSLIFVTAFLCSALYWCIRTLKIWCRLSEDIERNLNHISERIHEAVHAVTSLKAIAEIGMQTFQAAAAVYQKKTRSKKPKQQRSDDSNE